MAVSAIVAILRRRQAKQLQEKFAAIWNESRAVWKDSSNVAQVWFMFWLANRRQLPYNLITLDTPISAEEAEEGLKKVIELVGENLLRSIDIKTVGEFAGMIDRQLRHESRTKKADKKPKGSRN